MRLLILSAIIFRFASSCAATGGGGTVTTTVAPNTCTNCQASQITLTPGSAAVEGSYDPTTSNPGPNAAGCSQLDLICAGPANLVAFMQFNINQGGPRENMGNTPTVTARVVCTNGEWVYSGERVITEVNCSSAMNGKK